MKHASTITLFFFKKKNQGERVFGHFETGDEPSSKKTSLAVMVTETSTDFDNSVETASNEVR